MAGFGTDLIPGLIAGKPTIPAWGTIDLGQQQTKAINQNAASVPALEGIAGNVNSFNADQIQKVLGQFIPGFSGLSSDVSTKIDSFLKGEIPADVSNQVQDNAAARSLTGGFGGSGMAGNLTARDLGLTSLNLIDKGISSAESWIGKMASIVQPTMFNVASMFVTPQQQFEDTFQNQEAQFQRDYTSNMNDYEHSTKVLAAKDIQGTANTLLSYFGGAMMGGGGGGGGGMDISKLMQQFGGGGGGGLGGTTDAGSGGFS